MEQPEWCYFCSRIPDLEYNEQKIEAVALLDWDLDSSHSRFGIIRCINDSGRPSLSGDWKNVWLGWNGVGEYRNL